MLTSGDFRAPDCQHLRWRFVAIVVAISALAVSLATRTTICTISHGKTVQCQLSKATRQRLDTDATKWVPPVAPVAVSDVALFYPRVSPAGPPIPGLLFEESLYNRPPPSC